MTTSKKRLGRTTASSVMHARNPDQKGVTWCGLALDDINVAKPQDEVTCWECVENELKYARIVRVEPLLMSDGGLASISWVDLCLTFANAGLSAPPIPMDHRDLLVKQHEWFWSTRPDVEPFKMYFFEYVEELLTGHVNNYSAISHIGHGINSYGLNVSIVKAPIAVIFQHLWGGVYSTTTRNVADIAACFFEMRALLNTAARDIGEQPYDSEVGGVTHLLAWSGFRNQAAYYAKDKNGHWVKRNRKARRPFVRDDAEERDAFDQASDDDLRKACRRFLNNLTVVVD